MNSHSSAGQSSCSFETALGWFGVVLSPSGVQHLFFGHPAESNVQMLLSEAVQMSTDSPPAWWSNAQKLLVAYADGEAIDLSQIPIDFKQKTPFQTRVIRQLQKVGYGETVTYGELAKRAGSSKAARAVGTIMSQNRIPLVIPCHRVVASGGRLGGFSAAEGTSMKLRLLQLENPACEFAQP